MPAAQGQILLLAREEGQRESVQPVNFEGKKGHRVSQCQGLDSFFFADESNSLACSFLVSPVPEKEHVNVCMGCPTTEPELLQPFNADTSLSLLRQIQIYQGNSHSH